MVSASGAAARAEALRRIAASAWSFRWGVELEAGARFTRLARRLALIGAAPEMVRLALRAAREEDRHAALCAERARRYGERASPPAGTTAREIAPRGLLLRGRVLYEMVAACCITETESMGVLTTLLGASRDGGMRRTLRELAQDEVGHSRLGWAHLASEHAQGSTAFLAPLIPAMLQGNAPPDLFQPVCGERDDPALLDHGVLPHAMKREVFTRTLEDVVFPGLEAFGIDSAPARAWLEGRRSGPGLRKGP